MLFSDISWARPNSNTFCSCELLCQGFRFINQLILSSYMNNSLYKLFLNSREFK